jgi:hypothetical protein
MCILFFYKIAASSSRITELTRYEYFLCFLQSAQVGYIFRPQNICGMSFRSLYCIDDILRLHMILDLCTEKCNQRQHPFDWLVLTGLHKKSS